MKNRFARLAKEGFWIFLGQFISMVGLIVSIKVLTKLLSPSIYGEIAIGLTIATFVNQVIFGPISAGVLRFYSAASHEKSMNSYLLGTVDLANQATKYLTLPAVVIAFGLIIYSTSSFIVTFIIAFVLSVVMGYGAIFSGVQTAARNRVVVAVHQGLEPILRLALAVFLIIIFKESSQIVLMAYLISSGVILASQYYFFKKLKNNSKNKISNEKNWAKEIWAFSWPIAIFGVFTAFQLSSDRWALQIFDSANEVGLFAVVFQLGYFPLQVLNGLATQFLTPILYQRNAHIENVKGVGGGEKLNHLLSNLTLLMTLLGFLIALYFHSEIFSLLASSDYAPASKYLPWMVLSSGFFAAGQTLSIIYMTSKRTKFLMYAKIVTAIIAVGLNIVGAYAFGLQGIVFASLTFSIIFYLSMAISQLTKRQLKNASH
jgi:O-antigen/teichoic acid export membrane protein